jgi:hypothetical protein
MQFVVFAKNFIENRFSVFHLCEAHDFANDLRNFESRPKRVDPEQSPKLDSQVRSCVDIVISQIREHSNYVET